MAIYIPFSVDSPQQWSVSTPSQTHNTLDWPGPVPGFLASELVPCSAAAPVTSRQVFGSSPRDLGTTKSNPLRNGRLANTDQLATMPQDATGSAQKDVGVIPPPAKRRRCEGMSHLVSMQKSLCTKSPSQDMDRCIRTYSCRCKIPKFPERKKTPTS